MLIARLLNFIKKNFNLISNINAAIEIINFFNLMNLIIYFSKQISKSQHYLKIAQTNETSHQKQREVSVLICLFFWMKSKRVLFLENYSNIIQPKKRTLVLSYILNKITSAENEINNIAFAYTVKKSLLRIDF